MARVMEKILAIRRQRHALCKPLEEPHTQLLFQRQHRIRDGRLRHTLVGGRHRELAATRGSDKIAQLAQGDVVGCHGLVRY